MKQTRPVRVIKHKQQQRAESLSEALAVAERGVLERGFQEGSPVGVRGNPEPSERELKTVVAGWVREHRQRTEEYRRAFADLLKESGFSTPRAAKLA